MHYTTHNWLLTIFKKEYEDTIKYIRHYELFTHFRHNVRRGDQGWWVMGSFLVHYCMLALLIDTFYQDRL